MKKAAALAALWSTLVFASSGICMEMVPWVIVGGVTDSGMQDEQLSRVGITMRANFPHDLCAELSAAYAEYPVRYYVLPYGNVLSGVLVGPMVTENRTDWSAALSYPIVQGDVRISIRAGYRGAYLDNSITSFDLAGPVAGINAERTFTRGSIEAQAGYTPFTTVSVKNRLDRMYRFEGTRTISIFGDPRSMIDYRVVIWRDRVNAHRLGMGFEGETMFFHGNDRYYYGLAVYSAY